MFTHVTPTSGHVYTCYTYLRSCLHMLHLPQVMFTHVTPTSGHVYTCYTNLRSCSHMLHLPQVMFTHVTPTSGHVHTCYTYLRSCLHMLQLPQVEARRAAEERELEEFKLLEEAAADKSINTLINMLKLSNTSKCVSIGSLRITRLLYWLFTYLRIIFIYIIQHTCNFFSI